MRKIRSMDIAGTALYSPPLDGMRCNPPSRYPYCYGWRPHPNVGGDQHRQLSRVNLAYAALCRQGWRSNYAHISPCFAGALTRYKCAQIISVKSSRATPRIEPLSLDEAYLDVTDSVHCRGSATLIAQEIRQTIFSELQLTASAGVAPVKFLAKIASDMNKPNGQFVITPAEVSAFLQTLPLAKIPGVGKVSAAKLEAMGLRTCGDVQKCDLVILLKRFGKFGRILWERSQGIDERDVNSERLRKSVGVERTMAEDIHHWSECEAIIERLYPELERRLAKVKPDLLIARQGVKLKFDDFQQTTQEHVWPRLNKADLIATARKTWDERRGGRGVRLVGLHVTLLDPQMERQLVLGL